MGSIFGDCNLHDAFAFCQFASCSGLLLALALLVCRAGVQHDLSAAIWALKEVCLSFVLLLAMADRVKTLTADRAKTAAISRYVKVFRDELLRDLPDASKVDKNIKRNELLRLGRARFSQEPASVQQQYYKASDIQALPALKRSLELGCVGDTEHKSNMKATPPSSPHPSSGVRELIVRPVSCELIVEQVSPVRELIVRPRSPGSGDCLRELIAHPVRDLIVEPPASSGSAGVWESDVDMSSGGLSAPPSFQANPPQAILDSPRPRLKRSSLASECLEEDPAPAARCGMSSKVGMPQSSTTLASRPSLPVVCSGRPSPSSANQCCVSASAGVGELSEAASNSCAATLPGATAPARLRVSRDDELLHVLGGTLLKLQQRFGHSDGAAVLAASYRLVPHALTVQAPVKVKVAAILSLAAKMNATVGNEDLRTIWRHVAGTRDIENGKMVEQSIFNRFAMDSLDGPFASESMAMFDKRGMKA